MRKNKQDTKDYLNAWRRALKKQGWRTMSCVVPAELLPVLTAYKNQLMFEWRKKKSEVE